jgi:2-polyprenyl-3-methyl-5-hydroxy-6-metoxy-1,4-benzoquinol methylase
MRFTKRREADAGQRTPPVPRAPLHNAPEDWRRFDAGSIPTKESTPHLDAFLQQLRQASPDQPLTLLDVGCGDGRLSRRLQEQGFSVLGVDISPAAVHAARTLAGPADAAGRWLRFEEADVAADQGPHLDAGPFDIVVCQLVISIIGDARNRANLLRHVHDNLRPGGWLALSASGVSDTINAGYARLYAEDVHLTGERHSYLSRNEGGEVLYMTHHFTADELTSLLQAAGFGEISVTTERETSSRRPSEAAYFLYATCRRNP